MHWADGSVVAGYLLLTLLLGLWLSRRIRSARDFFVAGRRLPFWAIGMSLVVSDIGALEMIGGTAAAYRHGVAQANYEWIGCIPAMIVGGLLYMPIYWRSGVFSVPEFLGRRYGARVQGIQALVWLLFLGAALGVFFQSSAEMFAEVLGWPRWLSVGLTASIVSVYTAGGGLEAVVVTDVIQCGVLFVGGLLLAFIGLGRVGGPSGLEASLARGRREISPHRLRLLMPVDLRGPDGAPTGYPWPGILLGLGLVLSPAYWIGNQAIVQRVLGARDEWSARAAMLFGGVLKTIVPLAFVLPGLLGHALLGEQDPNTVYPGLIRGLLPVGLRGLMYAAFLAALMSSVDSYTNSAATIFTRDLYSLARARPQDGGLRVGRVASLVLIGFGVLMVPVVARYQTIYDAFQSLLSLFQGPTLALLLAGLSWRRATPRGGELSLLLGILGAAYLHFLLGLHYLYVAWWSFVLSALVLLCVSPVTRPLPPEELERLMSGADHPPADEDIR